MRKYKTISGIEDIIIIIIAILVVLSAAISTPEVVLQHYFHLEIMTTFIVISIPNLLI